MLGTLLDAAQPVLGLLEGLVAVLAVLFEPAADVIEAGGGNRGGAQPLDLGLDGFGLELPAARGPGRPLRQSCRPRGRLRLRFGRHLGLIFDLGERMQRRRRPRRTHGSGKTGPARLDFFDLGAEPVIGIELIRIQGGIGHRLVTGIDQVGSGEIRRRALHRLFFTVTNGSGPGGSRPPAAPAAGRCGLADPGVGRGRLDRGFPGLLDLRRRLGRVGR